MVDRTNAVDVGLWALFGLSAGVLVWFSVFSVPPTPSGSAGDELLHTLAYAATFGVLLLAGVWRPGRNGGPLAGGERWLVVGAVLLGVVLEFAQALVDRDPSPLDALANAIGVTLAWVVHRTFRRLWTRSRHGLSGR